MLPSLLKVRTDASIEQNPTFRMLDDKRVNRMVQPLVGGGLVRRRLPHQPLWIARDGHLEVETRPPTLQQSYPRRSHEASLKSVLNDAEHYMSRSEATVARVSASV